MADAGKPLASAATDGSGKEPPRRETKGKPNAAASVTAEEVAAQFGFKLVFINSDPSLKAAFQQFMQEFVQAKGKVSQSRFNLMMDKWADQSGFTQAYMADRKLELEQPADYAQALEADVASLRSTADAMGATVSDAALRSIAQQARRAGWNQTQQQDALAAFVDVSGGDLHGVAGSAQDDLTLWARKNGLTLSPGLIAGYAQRVTKGELTVDDVKGDLRRTYMAGAYPAWADKINAGFDVADLAAPYQQAAQSLLEDSAIGLDDPLMKKMLQSVDKDGKPVTVPLFEAERMIRADKRWQTTDNAYQLYGNAAENILRTWGFA